MTINGTASLPASDFPLIDTTIWMTNNGVVRALLRRDVQDDARPHEHSLELEAPPYEIGSSMPS